MRKILIIFCFLGFCNEILAHSLRIFAKDEGSKVSIKAFFYGGSPCKNCEILIKNGKQEFKANCDEKGGFILEKSKFKEKELEISINAGSGHFKSIKLALNQTPSNQNITNENDSSTFSELIKGFIAILIILLIFALLYFIKRRNSA